METKIVETVNGFHIHITPQDQATRLADCLIDNGIQVSEVRINFQIDQAVIILPFAGTLTQEKLQRFFYEKTELLQEK